jgi:uncharacterized membrane protein
MKNSKTKWIVYNGLMIALVFLGTYLTRIPTPLPGGYFNLGDAVIMIAAILLGRTVGFTAGAVGSFLADMVAYGFLPFAPITFVVKGIEGLIVAMIAGKEHKTGASGKAILAVAAGAVIMVAGYFFAEAYILSIFNKEFGLTAAFGELVPNLVQGGLSAVVGYALSTLLLKLNIKKYI